MEKRAQFFRTIAKSKFIRSVFLQLLSIFLIASIAIVAIVFVSFASEINKNVISERQKQLSVIESTISSRMEEISSIAYHVGEDSSIYLKPVGEVKNAGYEMSNTLSRYLTGNSFIEHLAFYRISEPDTLYTARGELSFSDFWSSYLHIDAAVGAKNIQYIQAIRKAQIKVIPMDNGGKPYFSYVCPLPQFSSNPQAFVLMLIPVSRVEPLLESQLASSAGVVAVFDAEGEEVYRYSTLEEAISIDPDTPVERDGETYIKINGARYVLQKQTSVVNGWTYVSVIRLRDIVSGLAGRQLLFIGLLLALMFVAVFAMLVGIVVQYRPISNLAAAAKGMAKDGDPGEETDERALLSSTFASLRGESEQKQHFETAYYAAEAANKAKSAFLSNMSHDIRTPMNAIVGMTAIAYKHADDPPYVRECLQKAQVASQYLLDIINNVLDMSRIESGRFTLSEEMIDLPRLIYGLMTILNESVRAKRQHLTVEAENIKNERVFGDSVRLTQVFVNILSNAVKFTQSGGSIRMRVRQEAEAEAGYARYVFTFADTGIGMAPAFVEKVFDTFTRAGDAQVSKVEGTGLGMAIAKSLVELMGGAIRCESELGKGTTFTVSLRMRLAEQETEAAQAEWARKYASVRVLIAGGGEAKCAGQAATFAEAGIHAEYALTAPEAASMAARALAEKRAYRLILINQQEDDLNGIAAVTAISAAAGAADTAYVLAASEWMEIRRSAAKDAGIDAFTQLPLFRSSVMQLLDRTFDTRGDAEPAAQSVIQLAGRHVLVAEDNAMNREIARKIIGETEAETTLVSNGREAVDAFSEHSAGYFDVILMDLQMPVMNGYEATAAIRALPRPDAKTVPIYALTASTFEEDVRMVREAGMNGHLGKPYMPEELYQILSEAMNR